MPIVVLVNGTDCEVEKEILHHLREVVTGFRYGLRIVFLALTRILDSPEGDLLEYGLTLVIGDIKAVEDCLIDCVCTGLEICLYPFEVFCRCGTNIGERGICRGSAFWFVDNELSRSSRWG